MDNSPKLFGSQKDDCVASCSEHFRPDELRVTIAIPDRLPNSATYTPPPFPVGLITASPARYDQFADSPPSAPEMQPPESLPAVLSKKSR